MDLWLVRLFDWTLNLSVIKWPDDSCAQLSIRIQIQLSTYRAGKKGIATVCVNVWQRAKDSIASRCIVAWCQWQHLTVECMTQSLCALQLIIEHQWTRAEACDITKVLMFTSASQGPEGAVHDLLHLTQVCVFWGNIKVVKSPGSAPGRSNARH